jgi:hypothetical protein
MDQWTLVLRVAEQARPILLADPDQMIHTFRPGRDTGGVVLVFRPDDFYARRNEVEPFVERSRLLYVAISRARQMVRLILPPEPHPLVAPFAAYAA